ncbi:hypothetical protein ABEB36_000969 [Hypothenemus hampei]|uniref:Methyltransferase-like protein 17, mitochondrial n=1 Tax=Hypothenemus hampei TaxID=57062 RepID=A0ABD1FD08_HYPHA
MLLNKITRVACTLCLRNMSFTGGAPGKRPSIVPDSNFLHDTEAEKYKPKHHPGRIDDSVFQLPDTYVKAIENTIEDYPVRALIENGRKLSNHLQGKLSPMEKDKLQETINNLHHQMWKNHENVVLQTEESERRFEQMINDKTKNAVREKIYNWQPVVYNAFTALTYLFARAAPDYAVLMKIFSEISSKDKNFKPRSLFDFGSGVGTVTWAANSYWKGHFFEYFNIDTSADMNDLAEIILQGGRGNSSKTVKGTVYRQFLPAANVQYDIVTSAYSLLELPSVENRLETVLNLWNKTQNYLVIVERGTNAGFKVVNEVRDFILQIDQGSNVGHVFSPCPHDKVCPRFLANDGTPCNFSVRYWTLPIGQKPEILNERYSYIVLKKGNRTENLGWPRIIRPVMRRSKHTICRLCTANGKLEEVIFTAKKHGKTTYHGARSSKWGDLLPIAVENIESNDENR